MKKHLLLVAIVLFAVISNSCQKDVTYVTSSFQAEPAPGAWRISSFTKDSIEIANQFAGYTFDCSVNGNMNIQDYSHSYNCRWNFIDKNHSMVHFYITGCDKNSILEECDNDWEIKNRDADHCYLSSRNSQNHRTMTLHRV